MRKLITMGFALALVLSLMTPATAITDGSPDGNDHPMVGQLLFHVPNAIDSRFDDPGSWFTCTGTLIDATTVLTAGHCTFGVGLNGAETTSTGGSGGNDMWVNFNEFPNFDILPPSSSFAPDDNAGRYAAWTAALTASDEWIRGTSIPHPDYNEAAFVFADAGLVELTPDDNDGPLPTTYAEVADLGYLEQFATRRGSQQRFTAVGYGLESGFPRFGGGDTRLQAEMKLVSIRGAYGLAPTSVSFSSNPGGGKGGTCFGDSGGPVFDASTDTIVAVTSFGISFNCVEPGGYYRIDTPAAQDFILGS